MMPSEASAAVDDASPSRCRSRWRRRTVAALLSAAAVVLVIWGVQWFQAEAALRQERTAWAQAGGPATFDEVQADPVPDDRNAAILWQAAFARLPDGRGLMRFPEVHREAIGTPAAADAAERAAVAAAYADVLEMAHQAAARDAVEWPPPTNPRRPGAAPAGVPLDEARLVGQLLILDAWVALDADDVTRAAADIAVLLDLAEDVTATPLLVNALLSLQLDTLALELAEDGYRFREPPTGAVWDRLAARDPRAMMTRVMQGDGAWTMTHGPQYAAASAAQRAAVMRAYRAIIAGLDDVYFRERDRLNVADAEAERVAAASPQIADAIPAVFVAPRAAARVESRLQLYRLARTVWAFERKHGRLPTAGDLNLPPEVVTGTTMGYEPFGDGFAAWTIAADQVQHIRYVWRWNTLGFPQAVPWWRNPHVFWDRPKDAIGSDEPDYWLHNPRPEPAATP